MSVRFGNAIYELEYLNHIRQIEGLQSVSFKSEIDRMVILGDNHR